MNSSLPAIKLSIVNLRPPGSLIRASAGHDFFNFASSFPYSIDKRDLVTRTVEILIIASFQRQFTLILQARDMGSAGVIEEASYSGIVLPGPTWHTLNHQGRNAHLAYRVRVQCADHYYNATCTKFCRPRNDIFGHYTCDENGDKVCIQGWKGVDCETGECFCFLLENPFGICCVH